MIDREAAAALPWCSVPRSGAPQSSAVPGRRYDQRCLFQSADDILQSVMGYVETLSKG